MLSLLVIQFTISYLAIENNLAINNRPDVHAVHSTNCCQREEIPRDRPFGQWMRRFSRDHYSL